MDFSKRLERAIKFAAGAYSHGDFLHKIHSDPVEKTNPLVYADWLEEQGHSGASKLVHDSMSSSLYGPLETHAPPVPAYSHHLQDKADYEPAVEIYPTMYQAGDHNYAVRLMGRTPEGTRIGFHQTYSPEDAHQVVSTMGDIPGAKQAQNELESRFKYLKKN